MRDIFKDYNGKGDEFIMDLKKVFSIALTVVGAVTSVATSVLAEKKANDLISKKVMEEVAKQIEKK